MKNSTRLVSIRLPDDVVQQLDRTAREESRTRTGQIQHALRVWLAIADCNSEAVPASTQRPRVTSSGEAAA
jgi:predicted transcriptional regulator